jgi:hypothetical protein
MNVKSILIIALLFNLKFDLYGQSQLYKLQVKIYPDTSNLDGCFFISEAINPVVEANKTKYNFDLKNFTPAEDHELYFGDYINSDCKLVFYNNQLSEQVLNTSTFIEPELEINTATLLVAMNVTKKTAADSTKKHELTINLAVPSLLTPDDKLLKMIINLTPLEQ